MGGLAGLLGLIGFNAIVYLLSELWFDHSWGKTFGSTMGV
jgi:hypothetical protein